MQTIELKDIEGNTVEANVGDTVMAYDVVRKKPSADTIQAIKGGLMLSNMKLTPKPKACIFIGKGDVRNSIDLSPDEFELNDAGALVYEKRDLMQPNKPLTEAQLAPLMAHIEEYSIERYYFSDVSRANLFHNLMSFGDDVRIAVHNASNGLKIYDIVANNKEDAASFDAMVAERDKYFKLYDEKVKERGVSREEMEHFQQVMRQAKANYRYWPNVKPINPEFVPKEVQE